MEMNEMGSFPVGRLLKKMSMPLIISMFVQVLYGLLAMFNASGDIPAAFCMDICTDQKHYAGLAGIPGYGDHPFCDCGSYG